MTKKRKHLIKNLILGFIAFGLIITGSVVVWISTLRLPDFKSFDQRKIQSSTKIYDSTGEFLLYDVHQDIKRTLIPYEEMGTNILNAAVAIEDSSFWQHKGIRISSIFRATVWAKLTGRRVQGGSTITQQLIKNTLLTKERSLSRKIKEWILSIKLEKVMEKEEILALYLNEAPYGGSVYGIKEASKMFFGKEPLELSLTEAAYLAAIPNAPTYYSPYGKNKDKLEARKNLVLKRMYEINFITKEEYDAALEEKVEFLPEQPTKIAAPHFVFFVKDYLEKKYGTKILEEGGLEVITTLDYELQKKAEEIIFEKSKENEKNYNGSNAAAVVIDPKNGHILSMVGSRDYFDKTIDGNFNVTTALRQPGSSFKPIVYAEAFRKGYTDQTTLFDVATEFNSSCGPTGNPLPSSPTATCYMPSNYDDAFRGPLTLRNALAQSINVVAVKLLYLVGVKDSIKMAHDLGITSLNDPDRYGLSLVIGGGETSLLDMTSVYSVFANDGIRNPYQSILSIKNSKGEVLEEATNNPYQVIDSNITRNLSSILSDNIARTPTFGANSILKIPGREVAVKTGTTNNNKDAWTIGYTPSVAVGVWVGNNDNTPMKKGGSAMAGPTWNSIMAEALKNKPIETFEKPEPIDNSLPPVIRGFWLGGETFKIDKISGKLATEYTPKETIEEIPITNVHNILYWIDKNNPLGPKPEKIKDPQYNNWEYGVLNWWNLNKYRYTNTSEFNIPTEYDDVHTIESKPIFEVNGITNEYYSKNEEIIFTINSKNTNLIKKIDIFVNNTYLTSLKSYPFQTTLTPANIANISKENTIYIIGYDVFGNIGETERKLFVDIN
ncbi:MAG: PBP1A family penicillin-binding protein [Candidatus Pacebacteria bacterium]|nr:PBP1A family penicillin-binding protein [Candidatus Paceibacterota bacterium]